MKRKTIIASLLLVMIAVGIIRGTNASSPVTVVNDLGRTVAKSNVSSPVTVVDDLNRTVTITSSERIVSIGPSCTEILYALGLGDRVIGVDIFSDYPPEAVAKQRIGSACEPDPEEVAALNPDLVVYYHWGSWDPTVETLSGLKLTVVALYPSTVDDILRDVRLVGNATGKSGEAEALASTMSQRIDEVENATSAVTARPKVYMEFWYPPPWTYGNNTWGHQLIELAGGTNAFGDAATEYVQTTDEEVIASNPDIIISLYSAMHYLSLEDIKERPGWDAISAVANGKVYLLDENLFDRPGPRIVDGLEVLAGCLHPELFGEVSVFMFSVNATILKTATQTMNVTGLMTANIVVIKAAGNCNLTVTLRGLGPPLPANLKLVGKYLDVDCGIPLGFAFILRIHYTEDQLRTVGVSEDSLRILMWDSEGNKWVSLNSAVNKGEDYVEAVATHVSCFALMGEPSPAIWEYPIPLWLSIISLLATAAVTGTGVYTVYRKRKSVQ